MSLFRVKNQTAPAAAPQPSSPPASSALLVKRLPVTAGAGWGAGCFALPATDTSARFQRVLRFVELLPGDDQPERVAKDRRFHPSTLPLRGRVALRGPAQDIEAQFLAPGVDQPVIGDLRVPVALAEINGVFPLGRVADYL